MAMGLGLAVGVAVFVFLLLARPRWRIDAPRRPIGRGVYRIVCVLRTRTPYNETQTRVSFYRTFNFISYLVLSPLR
jgi:hypothetical protein